MDHSDGFDFEGLFGNPNGAAYQKTELRTGPPLDYIAEKSRHALEMIHSLLKSFDYYKENRSISPDTNAISTTIENMHNQLIGAFHYQIVSYLALSNMLSFASDGNLINRLTALSDDEFQEWLSFVFSEGSCTG